MTLQSGKTCRKKCLSFKNLSFNVSYIKFGSLYMSSMKLKASESGIPGLVSCVYDGKIFINASIDYVYFMPLGTIYNVTNMLLYNNTVYLYFENTFGKPCILYAVWLGVKELSAVLL